MWNLLRVVLIGLALSLPASAQPALRLIPMGFQQLTSISSATSLTVPAGATIAVITVEAEAARYRDDGTAPTASVGILLPVASPPYFYAGPLSAFQIIQTTNGAIVNVSYYRSPGF
jgi:hypothetical protein